MWLHFICLQITDPGKVQFGQMSIKLCEGRLEFLSSVIRPSVGFEVTSELTTVTLKKVDSDLLAGLEQEVILTVVNGSQWLEKVCIVMQLKISD